MGDQYFPARHRFHGSNQRDFVEKSEIQESPDCAGRCRLGGEIEFRNLSFGYDGTPVLQESTCAIPAGTSLAIVGPTGSGKSTLVNLIPRIYNARTGNVVAD